MIKLSVVIITYNEEVNIERCLASIQHLADEVIVVDSFSTDLTQVICEKYGVRFYSHAFMGHIEQKNYALSKAKYDYILSLDADEAVDARLNESILNVKLNWQYDAYKMNRLTNYCGTWINHGTWYPDTKLRLAKKRSVIWGGDNPHDQLLLKNKGEVKHLSGDLLHYSYYTVAQHFRQQDKFTDIAAQSLYDKGIKASWYRLILNPLASFIKDIIIHRGYLDGASGFKVALISAKSVYWKYKKLRILWANN